MNCRTCSFKIEPERLAIIPNTCVCSKCANSMKLGTARKGIMVYSHKTGSEIQIMSADFYKENKKYFIPNGARSVMKNFSRSSCA